MSQGVPKVHVHPLWALSGPQTPRPIILHPPFLIPGYGPAVKLNLKKCYLKYLENDK